MRRTTVVLLLSLLAVPGAVGAQKPQIRKGFTAAVGVGYGSSLVSCDVCIRDRQNGLGLRFMFGGALKPNLILAGEGEGVSTTEPDGSESGITSTSFVMLWYPRPASGFFVKGGVGATSISILTERAGLTDREETVTPGVVAGIGYDIRVGRNFSLTPYATLLYAVKAGAPDGLQAGGNLLHVGLATTWH